MPTPYADVPDFHKSHTLHDTTKLPAGTVELLVNVATAGVVALQMWGDAAPVNYPLSVGTHFITGRFELALATGTTAVLSPASTVIARAYSRRAP